MLKMFTSLVRHEIQESEGGLSEHWSLVRHEIQEFENGELEEGLPVYWDNCQKNPGHHLFIPFDQFSLHHLPEGYRDETLFNYIKATGNMTVMTKTKMVSSKRPHAYPFCEKKGSRKLRTGSGEMGVYQYENGRGKNANGSEINFISGKKYERQYKTCPCQKCRESSDPSNVWWEVIIWTAAHVVFDKDEASKTKCVLFFDKRDSQQVILKNLTMESVDVERDWCELRYVTCDKLGEELYQKMKELSQLWSIVSSKYKNDQLTFIVSHPHGSSKQVSIGHWTENQKIGTANPKFDYTKLIYITCTCPGSSGATVHCVGFTGDHIHTGALNSGLNKSGTGYLYKA